MFTCKPYYITKKIQHSPALLTQLLILTNKYKLRSFTCKAFYTKKRG